MNFYKCILFVLIVLNVAACNILTPRTSGNFVRLDGFGLSRLSYFMARGEFRVGNSEFPVILRAALSGGFLKISLSSDGGTLAKIWLFDSGKENKIDVYNGFPENVARGFVSDFMRAALGIVDGSCDREIEYSAEGNAIRLKSSDMVLSFSNFARVGDVSAPMEISAEQSLLGIKLRVLDFEK